MTRNSSSIRWAAARPERIDAPGIGEAVGPWLLTRPLGQSAIGPRFMAVNSDGDQPSLAYRLDRRLVTDRAMAMVMAANPADQPTHRHLLMPREALRDGAGDLWVFAPFIGSARGILSLTQLAAARDGGKIGRCEAVFAGLQLLGASAHAHARGVVHGPIDADQVLVDPRGGLLVELYGLERSLRDLPVATDVDRAAETRSIVALIVRLATGQVAPAGTTMLDLPPTLRAWINTGSSEAGFASAAQAERDLASVLASLETGNEGTRSWIADLTGFLGWALTRR